MGKYDWPQAERRLKLGFVGGGRGALVGEWHAMGARMSNRWDIVSGALSSDPRIARESGADWMLHPDRIYDDYKIMAERESLMSDGIDAVAICTPNHSHRAIAETFLAAGINVICDKPLTSTMEDAEALLAMTSQNDLFLGVTYTYSFHAMVRQAKAMIAKGHIGKIRQAHVEYAQEWAVGNVDPKTKQSSWRRDPQLAGRASVTGDIGTHAFHLLHFITGKSIEEVSARFHVCGGAARMEDTAFMHLRMAQNIPATLWCTQAAPGNFCGLRIRIFGDEGGLEWDQEKPEILRYAPMNGPAQEITRGMGRGMLPEAEHLTRLPRGHSESLSDAWCNLYTEMAIGIEAKRNNEKLRKGVIEIPSVLDGVRGVHFVEAAADSAEQDGAWRDCWYRPGLSSL